MKFTVSLHARDTGIYLCRLEFEYDNWLQRKLENGGYWRAVPGVFNISSGRFAYYEGYLFPSPFPYAGTWLLLADTDRVAFHKVTGWKDVLRLSDFPEDPAPGMEGKARVGKYGANRMVGWENATLRWRVHSVDGEVRIFPAHDG